MTENQTNGNLYLKENPISPVFKGKSRSSNWRVLLFLVILFVLTTTALSVMLALTIKKIDKDDNTVLTDTTKGSSKDIAKDSNPDKDSSQITATPLLTDTTKGSSKDIAKDSNPDKDSSQITATPCLTAAASQETEVCVTEGCVLAAARVKNNIDTTVAPCDDFFKFACGSWLRKNVIPEDKSSFGTFEQLVDDVSVKLKYLLEEDNKLNEPSSIHKAKDFYKSCVNTDRIEELGFEVMFDYMESLGGWPIMGSNRGGNWNEESFNLEDLMIRLRNETNNLPIVDIKVFQDLKHPIKHIITMDQTSFGMPSREYYLSERNDTTLMAYQKKIAEIAIAFGADKQTAEQDAEDVVDLERELAKITVPMVERRDLEKLYNKMKVGDLANNFTGIDWVKLLKGTFRHVHIDIDNNEPLLVAIPSYFEKVGAVISKQTNRTLANYLVGDRVLAKIPFLPESIREINQAYKKVLTGSASQLPRWKFCGDHIMTAMQQVVGRLFAAKYFTEEAKKDVELMIENLRESFKEMITELNWMEDGTKSLAREKVDYLEPRIGYPDWIYNDTKLNAKYEQVIVILTDPIRSLISFDKAAVQTLLGDLRNDYDKSRWRMSPAEVNAYYHPPANQITFPAAILQTPFYSKDQPASLNYGGVGHVIGHEITHGFDDQGRVFDKDGILKSWWSDVDDKKYREKAQCMIDQYSSYVVPGTGNMTINGANTIGENIADNGGSKESFRAYQKWVAANGEEPKLPGLPYNGNQLFFINEAQVWCGAFRNQEKIRQIRMNGHSLGMYRVYGPLQNSEEFAKAFKCPAGSVMNPTKKCSVW